MSAVIEEARPGTRAKIRFVRMSASKVRVVLNLIRGKHVSEAIEILSFSERLAAKEVLKALESAVANAEHNEEIPEEELFVSACFADEGPTLKRFRPRARGRAGRIHKQTCHITIEVRRLTDDEIDERRSRDELKSQTKEKARGKKSSGGDRAKRVAKSRAAAAAADEDATEAEEAADTAAAEDIDEEAAVEDVAEATSSDEEASESDAASDEEASESDGASDDIVDSDDVEDEAGEEE